MGANTYTNTYSDPDAHAHPYNYTHTHPYSYSYADTHPHSYAYSYATAFFYHNVNPAHNVDRKPCNDFDQNHQFFSTINFITTEHHILNHHDSTLPDRKDLW